MEKLEAIADRGYISGTEILACDKANITATAPRPDTSGNRKKGMFVKADFVFDSKTDAYTCPAGKQLNYRYTREERGLMRPRCGTVEHPFGTIWAWMSATFSQMRRFKNVRAEMALHVLAYSTKRMINIMGIGSLMRAIAT